MDTPALHLLMGAYFHQDFELDGSPHEIVEAYLHGEPDDAARLADEILWVLKTYPDERVLKPFVMEVLGSYYLVDHDGGTYRAWLREIAQRSSLVEQ